ncbi:MAG TPA: MerR family transcriptional regulator [Oceanospirillales bacterium]|nr:MerR family transcriptional regulator [Oceanospirillaceae bacterium]HBS42496.1 MerR family transcriptional regulator [Oceanospirillales bacterium]|tara:strand:+ start:1839 stop:2174 length:336 start_codon:yes stop_codon:yes gene_type:complete
MKVIYLALLWFVSLPLMAAEPVWIDVRTPQEYNAGHLDVAINIPFGDVTEKVPEIAPEIDTTIYLYCRSGNRAAIAKRSLEAAGYSRIVNIGGLEDAEKFYVEKQEQEVVH